MVAGNVQKRTTLTAGVVETVVFENTFKKMALVKNGTGKVAYRVNGTVTDINDTKANILNNDIIGEVIQRAIPIDKITLVSDTNVEVQWDYDTSYRG